MFFQCNVRSKKVAERKIHEQHGLTFVTVTVDFPSLGFRQARLVSDSFELLPFFYTLEIEILKLKIGHPISYFLEIDFLHPGNFDENWNSRNCQLQKILRIFWCPGTDFVGDLTDKLHQIPNCASGVLRWLYRCAARRCEE